MGPSRLTHVICLVLAVSTFSVISARMSDKRRCADPKCETRISRGITLQKYNSIHRDVMSFGQNADVIIYSKEAGSNRDLWGVQIGNQRGYVPKSKIQEQKMLYAGPLAYEVLTERGLQLLNHEKEHNHDVVKEEALKTNDIPEERVPSAAVVSSQSVPNDVAANSSAEQLEKAENVSESSEKMEVAEVMKEIKEEKLQTEGLKPALDTEEVKVDVVNKAVAENVENEDPERFQIDETKKPAKEVQIDSNIEEEPLKPSEKIKIYPQIEKNEIPSNETEAKIEEKVENPPEEIKFVEKTQYLPEDIKIDPKLEEETVKPSPVHEEVDEEEEDDEEEEEDDEDLEDEDEVNSDSVLKEIVTESTPELSKLVKEPSLLNNMMNMNSQNPLPSSKEESVPQYFQEIPLNDTEEVISDSQQNSTIPPLVLDAKSPELAVQEPILLNPVEKPIVDPIPDNIPEIKPELNREPVNQNNSSEIPPMPIDLNILDDKPVDSVQETLPLVQDVLKIEINSSERVKPEENLPDNLQIPNEAIIEPLAQETAKAEGEPETVPLPIEQEIPLDVAQVHRDVYNQNSVPDVQISDQNNQIKTDELNFVQQKLDSNEFLNQPPNPQVEISQEVLQEPPINEVNNIPQMNEEQPPIEEELIQNGAGAVEEIYQKAEEEVPVEVVETTTLPTVEMEIPRPDEAEEETETQPSGPGLFEKSVEAVKSLFGGLSFGKAEPPVDDELDRIMFPEKYKVEKKEDPTVDEEEEYCEQVSPNSCPTKSGSLGGGGKGMRHPMISHREAATKQQSSPSPNTPTSSVNYEEFAVLFLESVLSKTELILFLSITAATLLLFTLVYYCCANSGKDTGLITRINVMERSLMNAQKQNQLIENELLETRFKLASIEDNSFGSNEMVIAIKRELELSEQEKIELQTTKQDLEKELETAAEAAFELNKMVSELLSNQHGSESIISSVELLQQQLNEQQETILSINTLLAEKSRENSELLVELNELQTKFDEEVVGEKERVEDLERENEQLREANQKLEQESRGKLENLIKEKDSEIRLLQSKGHEAKTKLSKSEARIQALEECIKSLDKVDNKSSDVSLAKVMNVANIKTNLLAAVKEKDQLAERLDAESQAKSLLEDHVKTTNEEVQRLKKEFNEMEKEKLEAQTKLGILQSYFKEKETQLQKELSVKEAQCMQQQGETTSTVEKIRAMQEEIQTFKSQNESLRNEIEVQDTAHKTQMIALEKRNHESWLAARQTERRLEELRSEAAALRRKLTALAEGGGNAIDGVMDVAAVMNGGVNPTANSPIHMDQPGSPIMPPLPPFMPPPPHGFLPPPIPHGFMPPPPFEMRQPPLGGHHPHHRYSPHPMDRDREGRYSPHRGGRFTPDSRYDNFSPYETETDLSPPPSPPHHHHHHPGRHSSNSYGSSKNINNISNSNSSLNPQQRSQKSKYVKDDFSGGSVESGGHPGGGSRKHASKK